MKGLNNLLKLTLTVLPLLAFAESTIAGEDPKTLPWLRGLDAVYVQVKGFDPALNKELRKAGLVEDQMQISVERRLEKAGIRPQSEDEYRRSPNKTVLLVKLDFFTPDAMKKIGYTVDGEQVPKGGDEDKYAYTG